MMPRKWEWIYDQCVRRGLKDAAKLAGEIDTVLLDCYEVKHTRDWKVFYKRNKMDGLADRYSFFSVIKATEFCVACQVSNLLCGKCAFGKECGECSISKSLFDRFLIEAEKGARSKTGYYDLRQGGINGK